MAVSGYQNPLEYQMYSAFEKKEEDAPITATSTPEIAPTTTAATPPVTRSSLGVLEGAGVTPGQRPAASILQGAGTPSAKDVLRSVYVEKPGGVLESEGISAASILEDYRKEQAAFRQQQRLTEIATGAEADLRKKEQDYIKNYKINPTQYNPYSFETKFGKLDFSKGQYIPRIEDDEWGYLNEETKKIETIAYTQILDGQKYVYLPEEFVMRGKEWGDQKVYNTGFLNKEALEKLYTVGQPIDAGSMGEFKYTVNPGWSVNEGLKGYDRGFLFKEEDWKDYYKTYLDGKFFNSYGFNGDYANRGSILGIGNYEGELVYVKPTFQDRHGRTTDTYYNRRINADGSFDSHLNTVKKGPIKELNELTEAVASIPYAAEFAFVASGFNPEVYAVVKALEVHGKGGDSADIIKSSAAAYVSASMGSEIATYGEALGSSITAASGGAISTTVANTIGTAVVQSGFNGFMAAATGQDIEDAMLTGAISGGLSANATTITNTVFGGADNVASLSKTLNLTVPQTQRIFTGAIASGSINSIVKNQSFFDAFTESLIVQGVSQSGANTVTNSLKGTLSPKALKNVQDNTRFVLQASARAAVRGEDIQTALARVAPHLQSRIAGQAVANLTSKDKTTKD